MEFGEDAVDDDGGGTQSEAGEEGSRDRMVIATYRLINEIDCWIDCGGSGGGGVLVDVFGCYRSLVYNSQYRQQHVKLLLLFFYICNNINNKMYFISGFYVITILNN